MEEIDIKRNHVSETLSLFLKDFFPIFLFLLAHFLSFWTILIKILNNMQPHHSQSTVREEIFAGINFLVFGHFTGNYFCDLAKTRINKDFAGTNFRRLDLFKDFSGIELLSFLKGHFYSRTLFCGLGPTSKYVRSKTAIIKTLVCFCLPFVTPKVYVRIHLSNSPHQQKNTRACTFSSFLDPQTLEVGPIN